METRGVPRLGALTSGHSANRPLLKSVCFVIGVENPYIDRVTSNSWKTEMGANLLVTITSGTTTLYADLCCSHGLQLTKTGLEPVFQLGVFGWE